MVRADYRTPKQARGNLAPGGKEYFAQLIKAKVEPEKHSMPICYRHIEGLAQSISRHEMTESVLVLVEPGLADPDSLSTNMFIASCVNVRARDRDSSFKLGSYKPDWRSGDLISPIGKSVDD